MKGKIVMEKIREMFRGRTGGFVLCGLEILVGVLLLIAPVSFTRSVIIAGGWLLVLSGVWSIVRYFTMPPEDGVKTQALFRGLLLGMGGAACITQYGWFLTAFPLLTVLYAIWMLALAAMKLQKMADMLRMKAGRWYVPAIAAGIAILLATVILLNPFGAVNAVWTFAGVSLIAEAVMELVGAFLH